MEICEIYETKKIFGMGKEYFIVEMACDVRYIDNINNDQKKHFEIID